MKILVLATFTHPDHHGGAERVIHDVSTRLAARGHEVELLTSNPGGAPDGEERDGVTWRRYDVDRRSPLRFYRSVYGGVRAALRDGAGDGADVVSLHQMLSAVAALAPGGVRAPRVLSFYAPYHAEYLARFREGHDDGRAPLGPRAVARVLKGADRYVLRRADEVLVLSEFSAGQVAELGGPTPVVAPAGVDLRRFHPAADAHERATLADRLGLPAGPGPLVVSVRRLVPRMGLSDLVEAVARLDADGLPARLAIAGDGPERQALEAQLAARGLGDRARLLGRVDEDDLYRAADVFVLPTRSLEGFGMATAEALASGLPVVATSAGATAELLADLPGARVVPPGDVEALAAALAPLAADEAARVRAGACARAHAERHLDWSRHLDALEQAFGRAGAGGGTGAR